MCHPTLIISLINHSNPKLLRNCLRSIPQAADGVDYTVYVVDNFSGGETVDELQKEFPDVQWFFNDRRRGFGFNHNQVLGSARGNYYCVLNDDTILGPGSLRYLIDVLQSDSQIGLVGPLLLNSDGSIQESAFREWTLVRAAICVLMLPRCLQWLKRRQIDPAQYGETQQAVAWLLGACLVTRKEVLRDIGVFDVVNFPVANNEEIDWCRRIRSGGFNVVYVPQSTITHIGGQSIKSHDDKGPDWMFVEMIRTQQLYFRKHGTLAAELAARLIHLFASAWNSVMITRAWLVGKVNAPKWIYHIRTNCQIAKVALGPSRNAVGPFNNR